MNAHEEIRYRRIQEFDFDGPGVRLRFVDRLARENGWGPALAARALEEYRRFAFLAVAAGHPVTPSEHVDQVWHLHLVYTRNYWEDFCPNALGQPLHHGPTKGGQPESAKHLDWYEKTLSSYERLFGERPPADLWPAATERFGRELDWRRVNWRENWVLPKRPLKNAARTIALLASIAVVVCCGLRAAGITDPLDLDGVSFLTLFFCLMVIAIVWNFVLRRTLIAPTANPLGETPTLTENEIAYLTGGKRRVFLASTVKLFQKKHLCLKARRVKFLGIDLPGGNALVPGEPLPPEAEPIDRRVLACHLTHADPRTAETAFQLPEDNDLRNSLCERGLMVPSSRAQMIQWFAAGAFLLVLAFGIMKIVVGIERHKPVSILVVMCIMTAFFGLLCLLIKPGPSRFGLNFLKELRREHAAVRTDRASLTANHPKMALAVALFGTGVLIGSPLDALGRTMAPAAKGGDGGCSGGCGSGGCGGGCGGCGGGD